MPYGGDAHLYAAYDPAVRNALLMSYPVYGRMESRIRQRLDYWLQCANCVMCGFMVDGMSRWDVPVPNMLTLELAQWKAKSGYSSNDGRNGPVGVVHAPNHRGVKGTEFVIAAVELLAPKVCRLTSSFSKGSQTKKSGRACRYPIFSSSNWCFSGYGLNAIEGMASGLPVLSNLDSEWHTRVFRRYAFLDECPVLSTSPESVVENLRILVSSPALREILGRAGREYAEKYYSYAAARICLV